MRRVVAIANGKGGVGKTSLTAGLAGLVAAAGYRVLVIDTDPQGNMRRDLGYEAQNQDSLALSILHGLPVHIQRDIRPNLDVIAGGPSLYDIPTAFISRGARGEVLAGLGVVLDQARPQSPHSDYDLVLIDTPPGEPVLQDVVFAAADYLIIPTRSDEASLDGLVVVAQRFAAARVNNPGLQLLGVLLFGVRAGSKRLRETVRVALEETLDGAAPVFEASIRYLESAAVDMRRHGLLPHELEKGQQSQQKKRLSLLRRGSKPPAEEDLLSRDASGLAGDYTALAREVLGSIAEREAAKASAAVVAR